MKEHEPPFEDTLPTEAEIAGWRWRAVEAANCAPNLSPLARRVLIELICRMDNKTRACFPSELRIAETMGVHLMSVKKAKAELRHKHGLIYWTNPGGPRHQSHYIFNWQRLVRFSEEAKERGEVAVTSRKSKARPQGNQIAIIRAQGNGSLMTTIDAAIEPSIVAKSLFQGSQTAHHGSQMATRKVATSLPEQPINSPTRTAHLEHAVPPSRPASVTDGTSQPCKASLASMVGKGVLEQRKIRVTPYPKLFEAFGGDLEASDILMRCDPDTLRMADKARAMKGVEAARSIIEKALAS